MWIGSWHVQWGASGWWRELVDCSMILCRCTNRVVWWLVRLVEGDHATWLSNWSLQFFYKAMDHMEVRQLNSVRKMYNNSSWELWGILKAPRMIGQGRHGPREVDEIAGWCGCHMLKSRDISQIRVRRGPVRNLIGTIQKLKRGKAAAEDGILNEFLKHDHK